MDCQALISLIIPVYNAEDCLVECLESIIAQTYKNIEVIMVNDGSTDNSGSLCDSYVKRFNNAVVIHKRNQGVNYTRRDGFMESHGEYISFVDADDILEPHFLSNNLKLLIATHGDLTMCKTHSFYGATLTQSEIDQCRIRGFGIDYAMWSDKKKMLAAFMTNLPPHKNMAIMCVWGKLYRRALVKKINWKIANYRHAEDYFISAQIFDMANSVCLVNEIGYFYRRYRLSKITHDIKHNIAPNGKNISNFAHIPVLANIYREIAKRHNLNLDLEIIIFQCRLYCYWLDKMVIKDELNKAIWQKYIVKHLYPLIDILRTPALCDYMSYNLICGSELYEKLIEKLEPIYDNPDFDQYLQYKIRIAKDLAAGQFNNINYDKSWVIMDRLDTATDNGYHFYKWLQNNHPEVNMFFVINNNSDIVPTLESEGFNLVYANTDQHRQLLNNSLVELYSNFTFNICIGRTSFNSLKVYLGHGVKKDNSLNPGLGGNDLFVTTFKREFEFYSKNHHDFRTILTGMPRYENLIQNINQSKDKIVIAPTWRRWLSKEAERNDDYFAKWYKLINSKEIKSLSKVFNLDFIVHPEMEEAIKLFIIPKYIRILKYEDLGAENTQKLMKQTKLLITDFSSVSFDFAIAGAIIVYFQFDKEQFYSRHTGRKAWYDYEKDGFGQVFYSLGKLLKYVAAKEFNNEAKSNMYRDRLNNLVYDYPTSLSSPSENIYKQVIKSIGRKSY